MKRLVDLTSFTSLRGPTGHGGLLGAILISRRSNGAVALTAAQLGVRSEQGYDLFADEICVSSPHSGAFECSASDVQSVTSMLIQAPIDRNFPIGSSVAVGISIDHAGGLVKDASRHIGQEVEIVGFGGEKRRVRLVSAEGVFAMPRPGSTIETEFIDALELARVSSASVLQDGEIGALVRLISGELLGVIIAGGRDVAFAAPIGRFAAARELQAFSPEWLRDYNRRRSGQRGGAVARRTGADAVEKRRDRPERLRAIMQENSTASRTPEDQARMEDSYLDFERMVGGRSDE